jgi:transcriptional regulator with XRE-family HTH domain
MVSKSRRQYSVDAATFAERLNRLFAVIWPPGRGPYRNFEITQAVARRGHQLSAPYLSQLRSGTRKYPSPRTAEMLAEFFGVEVDYFDPDTSYARALDAELDWLELVHDKAVRELTTALMTLTPGQRDELLGRGEGCQNDCFATIAEQIAELPPVGAQRR